MLLTKLVNAEEAPVKPPSSTPYPLWDPLSAKGKIVTRPPYIISFTPYTTPTPLPHRPDWKKDDWLKYFKENHPNFWFQKQYQAKAEAAHNVTTAPPRTNNSSEFDYSDWKNWSPETWLKWSKSKEYKEKYLNVLNPYRKEPAYKIHNNTGEDFMSTKDYRDNQPVYLSEDYAKQMIKEQEDHDLTDTQSGEREESVWQALNRTSVAKTPQLPPRTYFPKPTYSPTKDPFYLHHPHVSRKGSIKGISNEYIYASRPQARRVEEKPINRERQLRDNSPLDVVNPVDLLLKTSEDSTRIENTPSGGQNAQHTNQEFTIPYSNYIKNLISKSGAPILEPVAQQQQRPNHAQPGRTRPPIIRIGDAQTYDYSRQRGDEEPIEVKTNQGGGGGSTSSSSSRTPAGFASSSAAAAGPGASTSTSTRSGLGEVEETPNDNTYYPCLDNSCDPVTSQDEFEADYRDEDEQLLAEIFGSSTPRPALAPADSAQPSIEDAVIVQHNRAGSTTPPPVFKECTTLEECLGQPVQADYDTYLEPLEYSDYEYRDLTAQQPQHEFQLGQASFRPPLSPQDSIVTKPIFTPDGTLLFEAEQSPTEAKLDKLIDSLGSLISLLNSTKGNESQVIDDAFVQVPAGFGAGQMGHLVVPNNTQQHLAEESLLMNAISHHLGDAPLDGNAFFNLKSPLAIASEGSGNPKTTIPPHLIPLGPDGQPLLHPDGSPTNNLPLNDQAASLTEIFPFLRQDQQHLHQIPLVHIPENLTEVDNRDFLTKSLNMVRELPMDTRRRMLAGMMMGVPMAALTMATLGAPTVAIAPMALAIPGFLFAAFTETDGSHARQEPSHQHNHHHPRRGIAGLIDAVRDFRRSQNNATLTNRDSTPDTEHHHHHFFG